MAKQDLGGMGEYLLGLWAAEIGVTANRSSDKDAAGWDWFLEWPIESLTSSTKSKSRFDKSPSPVKCLVQVKSTNSTRSRVDVKLSNWFHLVRNPLPAFFLIFDFAGQNECQKAFLVHVGPALIAKAQKRLLDVYIADQDCNLNKNRMSLTWTDEDALTSLDSAGLEKAVMTYVVPDMDEYVKNKQDLTKNVGYEDNGQVMQVTINIPEGVDPEDHMVDFDLGIISQVKIDGGTLYEERFGRRISQSNLKGGSILEITTEPIGSGEIVFTDANSKETVTLSCQVYVPSAFGRLIPKEKIRARFSHKLMNFIIPLEGEQQEFDFSINFPSNEETVSIIELIDLSKLILLISEVENNGHELLLSAKYQNSNVRTGRISTSNIPPDAVKWANLVRSAWILARYFEMETCLMLSAYDLSKNEGALLALAGFLDPQRKDFRMTFWINEDHVGQGDQCAFPMIAMTQLGQKVVGIGATLFGTINLTENKKATDVQCEVISHDLKIESQYLADEDDIEAAKKWSEKKKNEIIEKYENQMMVINLH